MVRLRHVLLVQAAALLLVWGASAGLRATDPPAPTLTDTQRLVLSNRVLALRVAQLELDAAVKELAVPGYLIDLQTITYVKAPEKASPP